MRIFNFDKMSPEWWAIRRGRPTASRFDRIITPTGKKSTQVGDYICELLGQLGSTELPTSPEHVSRAMLHGLAMEPEVRSFYSFARGVEVQQVGFVLSECGRFGCSPDGMALPGLIECKAPQPKTHVAYLLARELPPEYRPQVHGQLYVTKAPWVDFISYCRGFEPLLVRVEPNDYTESLGVALEAFWVDYVAAVKSIFGEREMRLVGMDRPIGAAA